VIYGLLSISCGKRNEKFGTSLFARQGRNVKLIRGAVGKPLSLSIFPCSRKVIHFKKPGLRVVVA